MSRILILGASGFIGKNMAAHFEALGHEVHRVGLTRAEYSYPHTIWHRTDLRESNQVQDLISTVAPDIIIQAAATTSGSKDITNNPALHVTDNAVMNSYVFRAAAEAKVKHVIFFSCTVMYGSSDLPQDENSPIDIHPKYFGVANTKLYCEKLCEFYSRISDTKFTAIRHSNIYGPHDKYDLERSHVFGATVAKVMNAGYVEPQNNMAATECKLRHEEANKITLWGTGEESRDLLYVSDLCDFVEAPIDKQPTPYALYNCGYGVAFKIKDLAQKIIDASPSPHLRIEHDLSAPTIPTSLYLDCKKARTELGWWPKVTLTEGIKKTIEWYQNDR